MNLDDLDRIEADALKQSHLELARVIAVTPRLALELCRLARVGMAVQATADKPRPLHVDDGA